MAVSSKSLRQKFNIFMGALICWKLKNNHFKKIKYLSPFIVSSRFTFYRPLASMPSVNIYTLPFFKIKHLWFEQFSRQENCDCSLIPTITSSTSFAPSSSSSSPRSVCQECCAVKNWHHIRATLQENKRVNYFVLSSSFG